MRLVFSLLTHGRGFEVVVGPALGNNFPGREQRRQRGVQSGGHLHHVHADDVEAVKRPFSRSRSCRAVRPPNWGVPVPAA